MLNSFFGNIKIYEFVFSTISWYWDGTGTWNFSPLKRGTCLSCIINTMDADGPTIQGARASAAVILTSLCRIFSSWSTKRVNTPHVMWKMAYSVWNMSASCLLMPWRLPSPGHQQTWCWLCNKDRFCSSFQVNYINLHHSDHHKTSHIRHTLVVNKIVDHSDVVGASLRCSWSIGCWRCSSYIFTLDL